MKRELAARVVKWAAAGMAFELCELCDLEEHASLIKGAS